MVDIPIDMKNQISIKNKLNKMSETIKTAPMYAWYPHEQTIDGLKIRKLIEYAKVSDYKKEK